MVPVGQSPLTSNVGLAQSANHPIRGHERVQVPTPKLEKTVSKTISIEAVAERKSQYSGEPEAYFYVVNAKRATAIRSFGTGQLSILVLFRTWQRLSLQPEWIRPPPWFARARAFINVTRRSGLFGPGAWRLRSNTLSNRPLGIAEAILC